MARIAGSYVDAFHGRIETPNLNRLYKALVVPEMSIDPPESSNPQITRENYEYSPPKERLDATDELILTLEEVWHSLDFLNRSDPEPEDNFPGGKMVIAALIAKVREYRGKVEGWL